MGFLPRLTGLVKNIEGHLDSYDEKTFRRIILLLYITFASANIITHEMWRDELQAWMIADNSHSLTDLLSNLRYEGHPPLWHLMLYATSRLTHNPAAMQVLHLAIAVVSVYIFLRFAPFTRLQRLLFVFGYFPLYEYAAISRNYAIGLLLILAVCAVWRAGAGKKYWLLATLLFLLAQTSVYGFLIAVSIAGTLVFECLADKEARAYAWDRRLTVLLSICVVLAGLVASAAVMKPAPDYGVASEWTTRFDLKRLQMTLATVWKGYVPLPRLKQCYWNSNILPGRAIPSVLAAPLLCFVISIFLRKRVPLVLLSSSAFLILAFQYFVFMGFLRHFGHLFIMFIVCLWLERLYGDDTSIRWGFLQMAADYCNRHKSTFIGALLAIHLIAGVHASVMEWLYPFSQARNTAIYIKQNQFDNLPIVGYADYPAAAVAGYLGQQIYYANSDRAGSFLIFDGPGTTEASESTMLERAHRLAAEKKSDVLLVLNQGLKTGDRSISKLVEFTGSIVKNEGFYLYLLRYRSE